jgi:hypothetical protein
MNEMMMMAYMMMTRRTSQLALPEYVVKFVLNTKWASGSGEQHSLKVAQESAKKVRKSFFYQCTSTTFISTLS